MNVQNVNDICYMNVLKIFKVLNVNYIAIIRHKAFL